MGRFSTTVNVKCSDLAAAFSEIMKNNGCEPCKEDEAELSYLVVQGSMWATLADKNTPGIVAALFKTL